MKKLFGLQNMYEEVAVLENEEMDAQTMVGEEIEVQDFTHHSVELIISNL
jgi:hypothetical protein